MSAEFSQRLPIADHYDAFLADLKNQEIYIPPADVLESLVKTAQNLDTKPEEKAQARAAIHSGMLRAIPFAIKKWASRKFPPEEYIARAFFVIDDCIRNYKEQLDDGEGSSFPTYVFSSLEKDFKAPYRFVQSIDIPVTLPVYGHMLMILMRKTRAELQQQNPSLSDEEWYEATLAEWTSASYRPFSKEVFNSVKNFALRRPIERIGKVKTSGREDSDTLVSKIWKIEDRLIDTSPDVNPEEAIEGSLLRETIIKVLDEARTADRVSDRISDRERLVLELCFYGFEGERLTLAEIGEFLGISVARVGQIKERTLEKLRSTPKFARQLRDFYK